MKIIFIIGNIGSGKTTACELLNQALFPVSKGINLDKIGHSVFDDPDIQISLHESFGNFQSRAELGKIIFSAPENVDILNKITHPAILKKYMDEVDKARKDKIKYLIVEETAVSGPDDDFLATADYVICCKSDEVRNDNPHRKNLQLSTKQLENFANEVINNNGTINDLNAAINKLAEELRTKLTND